MAVQPIWSVPEKKDKAQLQAGYIKQLEVNPKPMGEDEFFDIVNTYAEQAFELKHKGFDVIIADNMRSLPHCRAAILGAKQTKLPLIVTLEIEADGETNLGCDLAAALIVCQSLGAEAFALSSRVSSREVLLEYIEEISQYSTIPLLIKLNFAENPQTFSQNFLKIKDKKFLRYDGTIFMASETEPYFLDEFFEQSKPILCGFDMADELLEAEETSEDVLTVQVDTIEDAYNFAENSYMLNKAVSFLSDSEEALEMALLLYNGRAFVDSRSNMDEKALKNIAEGYGAIIR